jgi:hypothetical protein
MAIKNEKFGDGAGRRRVDRVTDDSIKGKGEAQRDFISGTRRFGIAPQVTGLALEQSPGAIEASWDAAPIGDLKRYEIHVSTSAAFVEPLLRTTNATQFTYEEGTASTDYYVRVRAVNNGNQAGDWSLTETAQPGAVTAADIADGSITAIKLASNAVTNAKMDDNAVNTNELVNSAVTTAKLATEAVNIEDLTYTSGTTVNSGTTELQWATENITSEGFEIKIEFGMTFVFNGGATDGSWTIRLREGTGGGGTALYTQTGVVSDSGALGVRTFFAKIATTPGTGSRTYEATIQRISGDRDITVANRTIHLQEIKR